MNTEPTKAQIKKWCNALRSGEYRQATGALQKWDNGYCCLGVACVTFTPKEKLRINESTGFLFGILPSKHSQKNVPKWIFYINSNFSEKTGEELWRLNDTNKLTFDEIADLLEAVYLHRVLD